MPPMSVSPDAYAITWASLNEKLSLLEAALPGIAVPVGFVVGHSSPMPITAATDTAERIPGAWVDVIPGAGHFPWFEQPGCVRAGLERLVA
jgi:pimeloyl-ACP methyl ester carboxylesterase